MKKYKYCPSCGKQKLVKYFYKDKCRYDGLQSYCKSCSHSFRKKHYAKYRTKISTGRLKRVEANLLLILDYLKSHPCVDCGESNPIVLDFDHVRGKKVESISELSTRWIDIKNIWKEIKKCEIRCANCHRIKTAKERNTFKWRIG